MRMRTSKTWLFASLLMTIISAVVTVNAQQTYSLAWNSNPEPDLIGYRVHVGTSSRKYSKVYSTTRPAISINDLPAGSYYFAVTAVNSAGLESAYSAEVTSSGAPSGPAVTSTLTATAIRFQVQTAPNAIVTFDTSTDLANWQFYANRIANASGLVTLNEARSTGEPVRFFRARMP